MFTALRHRNFRLFWTSQFVSQTGTWMQSLGRGWLVLELSDKPFWLGAVGAAGTFPILLFALAGGVVADRFPKRSVLMYTHGLSTVITLVLAALTHGGLVTVWQVMVLAFLLGTVKAVEMPVHQSFVVEMVGKEDLMNAIALNSSTFNTARVLGPAVAGFVVATAGIAACFYLNAVSYLPVIVAFWLMRKLPPLPARAARSVGQDLREGLQFVRREKRVQALVALVAAASFFGFPYLTMMPVFARDVFHIGPGGLGGLLALSGGGSVAGALILAARSGRSGKGKLAVGAGVTFAASLILFALSPGLAVAGPALVAAGWGMVTLIAPVNTLVQSIVPDELRGRVMSLYSLVLLGMMPLGNMLVGSLAQAIGTPGAVALSGGALGISIMAVTLMRPEVLKL
jgi:predicted MFS family arabinose efflux permease